ncbi:FAD-binding domain-containing protein [Stutzerimonas nosocomialis]|uniref:FAD-binding domain-containing protein n=1 Tax=Stutzerimonas nosocomialis TaxID=1056496 RepID=UPI001F4F7937|nr:FAD-binding domain-containing protein [Stutzerimonas nosocomialis]
MDQLFAPGFDPQGRFLRHWLPELAGLDDRATHDPVARAGLFETPYLPPIVDLPKAEKESCRPSRTCRERPIR